MNTIMLASAGFGELPLTEKMTLLALQAGDAELQSVTAATGRAPFTVSPKPYCRINVASFRTIK